MLALVVFGGILSGVVWFANRGAPGAPAVAAGPRAADPASTAKLGPTSLGPVAICFAPGTPNDVVARVEQAMRTDPTGAEMQLGNRWTGTQGAPKALTWSFVPDGLNIPSGGAGDPAANSMLFATLDASFAGQGGRATWIAQFQACFNRWAELTGTSYTRVKQGANDWDDGASWGSVGAAQRGDVRISMKNIDDASGILAYNFFPDNGDMVLDQSENWSNPSNSFRFLRNIVMHEHGHGIGLAHECPIFGTRLMEPFLSTGFDGPQHDDLRGGQRFYGDAYEDNDTSGTATNMGTLTFGVPVTFGPIPPPAIQSAMLTSIDASGDLDFYKFTITAPAAVNVTVQPLGFNYEDAPQNCSDGQASCCAGTFTNSLLGAQLRVQILGQNGTTVLGTSPTAALGQTAIVSSIGLPTVGSYYVKVSAISAPNPPQLYSMTVSLGNVDCNTNGIFDPQDIQSGHSQDCNSNLVPDECEIAGHDCNSNGRLDTCDVALGAPDCDQNGRPDICDPDCNSNGTVDLCDIVYGGMVDCDSNQVPDACQLAPGCTGVCSPDCNSDGRPDVCDVAYGPSSDCNTNYIPDECETDCNSNGVADACEFAPQYIKAFSPQGPFYFGQNQTFTLIHPPPSATNVVMDFQAFGDFGALTEYATCKLNGTPIGILFEFGADCEAFQAQGPAVATAEQFNTLVNGGNAVITLEPSNQVDNTCAQSYVYGTVTYTVPSRDCNSNGVLDNCEFGLFMQIILGINTDPGQLCVADLNGDGKADGADVQIFVTRDLAAPGF